MYTRRTAELNVRLERGIVANGDGENGMSSGIVDVVRTGNVVVVVPPDVKSTVGILGDAGVGAAGSSKLEVDPTIHAVIPALSSTQLKFQVVCF